MRDFPWRAPFLACCLAFAPNFITTASSANGNSSAAQPTPIVNPSALQFETELAQAQLMEKDGNWNAAEQLLTSVIDDEGAPKSLRDQSKLELEKILASRRQLAQLDLIEKYISDGRMDLDRASKQLSSLLSKASSEIVIRRVASLSNKDEPFIYWKPVIKVTTWIANVLPYLFVFFVMGIIRAALFFCYGARSGKWVLADITDSTSRNATSAIAHHFSHWAEAPKRSVTSGLLVMEASLLPAALPIAPSVDSNVGKFSVSTSLNSSDLTIWGVNLGSLWRAIMTKIERELEATVTDKPRRLCRLAEWETRIGASRTVAELLIIEAKAAADYWRAFADRGLREAKGGNLPRTWLRFANRQKGAGFLGSKNASHPINAMLNYAYTVEAGRLAKALAARGLALQIGFLHSDKTGRNSLVWDAIEPLRPIIDARVFRYIETREFKRRDFVQTSASTYRLERDIIAELLTKVSLLQAEIDEAADTMLKIIERYAGAEYRLFKADLRRRKRVAKKVAPSN